MQAFNGLNTAIQDHAKRLILPRIHVSDNAPQTFEDVVRSYRESGSLVIWSGGSENTIFGDSKVNYLFRAIHDLKHIELGADFTLQGETRVALAQMSQVGTELARLIEIEVIAQAREFFESGSFPENQLEFVLKHLTKGV